MDPHPFHYYEEYRNSWSEMQVQGNRANRLFRHWLLLQSTQEWNRSQLATGHQKRICNIFDLFFFFFFLGSLSLLLNIYIFFLYLVQCAVLRLHKIHKEMWMSCERDYAKEALDKSLRWLQCWFHICWSDVKIFFQCQLSPLKQIKVKFERLVGRMNRGQHQIKVKSRR